jgi:hypothetical protein
MIMAIKKKTTTKKASTKSPAKKRPASKAAAPKRPAKQPAAANQLRRTYKGQEIVVDIVDGQYLYDGQTFKSISGLARHIVGYQISGPVFFKLTGAKASKES